MKNTNWTAYDFLSSEDDEYEELKEDLETPLLKQEIRNGLYM